MKQNLFKGNKDRGFTILYAVLVGGLTLSIGLAVFNLTIRQLNLSAVGRESQFAFYAADSGVECAIYWDLTDPEFFAETSSEVSKSPIPCGDRGTLTVTTLTVDPLNSPNTATTTFILKLDDPLISNDPPACALVTVGKYPNPLDPSRSSTIIESRGQNDCDSTNPTRVERALRLRYN
jgi:hypothetical protein